MKITNSELKKKKLSKATILAKKFIVFYHALSSNYRLTRENIPPFSSDSGFPSSFDLSNDSFGSFSCLPVDWTVIDGEFIENNLICKTFSSLHF